MLTKVVAALQARTGDLRKVATDTGIPYDTILRVKNQENDPSFGRVAALYVYLFPSSDDRRDKVPRRTEQRRTDPDRRDGNDRRAKAVKS